ncbi:hypothetical protein [Roseiflexus sp.]|uniref:hypothetical protein n=1 Tax=Roseiflexus sp. TaxID=2562120 RepID=UPI00398A8FA6
MISSVPLILRHPDKVADEVAAILNASGLIYGAGESYTSLITPSSCLLDHPTTAAIAEDLVSLQRFYRIWNDLYRASLAGDEPRWIAGLCEYGLRPEEIQAQRLTLAAGLEPRLCRVDYIAFSPRRVIAEVQWKSGGLGLFFGIHNVCAAVAPVVGACPGDPVQALRSLVREFGAGEPVAVSPVRAVWLRGERRLQQTLERQGVRYIVFDRRDSARRIFERNSAFVVSEGGKLLPIDFLYGHESLPMLASQTVVRLARAAADHRIWVETPLNYVYRQKWGMALPFMPDYAHLFDDQLRALFGAVVLLRGGEVDLSPLAGDVPATVGQQLCSVRTIDDIARLSTAARRFLVLKCGAGSGAYYSHGRGVLRVNGSHRAAQKTLDFVKERLAQGEPWIVQRYVHTVYSIDICPPWATHDVQPVDAHARFMVYATFDTNGSPRVIGGLGNFSSHWKVSGRLAGYDERGRLTGAAFNDMRFSVNGTLR